MIGGGRPFLPEILVHTDLTVALHWSALPPTQSTLDVRSSYVVPTGDSIIMEWMLFF